MIKKTKKGFTIVELVIVIGVIGILSAILIPTFIGVTANANKARTKSDLASAYAMYAADAADGYYGEEKDGKALDLWDQEKIALAKEAKPDDVYVYTLKDGWATTTVAKTTLTSPAELKWSKTGTEPEQVKYGGYLFFSYNLPTA